MQYIESSQLFELKKRNIPIIDVRSPSEYVKGHIPHAINISLFNDEERAHIGITYKNKGKEEAIMEGLKIVGPKLTQFVEDLKEFNNSDEIIVHCWRGGMRSSSMAWLYNLTGLKVYILKDGYKAYRNYVIKCLQEVNIKLCVLGGRTGSGKTQILHELAIFGEQIIDLEKLADHKGSAFGWIGRTMQVGTEQFENLLWEELSNLDLSKDIWVENESRGIGIAQIPEQICLQIRNSSLFNLELELEERLDILVATYALDNSNDLILSFEKIRKKLGHLKTDQAIEFVKLNNFKEAARIALEYYDKTYDFGMLKREKNKVHILKFEKFNKTIMASKLLEYKNKL
ncbi:MAG: tRNA 2-selenouridine(34) synthase MnmH [Saprospiraceae bacterium]